MLPYPVLPVKLTIMTFLRRFRNWLMFNLMYLGKPPWDTGISPPELIEFIEAHPPGRALDLGCGTGTNALTLAKYGWDVTGVDFAPKAISRARRKAREAGLDVDFRIGDVTRPGGIDGTFDLVLDIGCFHSLGTVNRQKYEANLEKLLAPNGTYMLYTFYISPGNEIPGVSEDDIRELEKRLYLYRRKHGADRGSRRSAWFWFRKTSQI